MVQVTVGTNTSRKTIIVEDINTSIMDIMQDNNVNPAGACIYVDGELAAGADTLADLGYADGERCSIICVVKADSAR